LTNREETRSNVIPLSAARPHSSASASASASTSARGTAARQPAPEASKAESREEDAKLVERCRRGDRQAFRSLVERYQRKVYTLALGFVRDPDQAYDISQEAFLKVFRHLDSFQGASSFYTWVYRITVNLCIDLRRKKSHGTGQAEFDERIAHEEVGSPADQLSPQRLGFDPARALHNAELRKKLLAALEQLSEQHRTVLLLREVDGLSYKEIADVMECPEGTVMSRLFHARRQMQELLREFADVDANKEAATARRG
jgi:RNA polymerase sigma-70 factor (ECF subfamily)